MSEKKKPEDATIEEIINDLSYYEDPDQLLYLGGSENGGVAISSIDFTLWAENKSLDAAIRDFARKSITPEDYERWGEHYKLDWS